jgi:hypothetical protein
MMQDRFIVDAIINRVEDSGTYCMPNAIQRLAGIAVRSYEVTGCGGFAVRDHVRETGADAYVVVQFLRGALGPRHHLLYGCRLAPAVLVWIEHDVVYLEGTREIIVSFAQKRQTSNINGVTISSPRFRSKIEDR